MTLFSSFEHVSVLDKEVFKQTLKTTLIKDYTDIPIFERCFLEFFEQNHGVLEQGVEDLLERLNSHTEDRILSNDEERELRESMESFLREIDENSVLEKSPEELLQLFLEELELQDSSGGGLGMMLFNARSRQMGSSGGEGEDDSAEGDNDFSELDELLQQMLNKSLSRRRIGTSIKKREEYLLNKFIYQITPEEIREMRELIKRFGQKLKTRISLRKKRVKHGGIDIKRTFRSNMQYGGVPFKIYYKDKKVDRPQLVVLCDISGSVNQYSRFMLLLTHTLQGLFSRVRTFAFISNMVEITPLFMEMDPERAVNSIFQDTNFTYGWGSNYGRSFNQFIQEYSDSLTGKTTVLVLGDGRNNNQDPGLDSLVRIRERSRNLYWLNPDKKHLWNWSDSIAYIYKEYCDEMKEVNNFLDLSEFIDKLFYI